MKGLIHIYEGDGKGKTSAGIGLAVRCAGSGGKVLYTQFLKNGTSSELKVLSQIQGIDVLRCEENIGFVFLMTEEEKEKARNDQIAYFRNIVKEIERGTYRLLIMDELLDAYNLEMVDPGEIIKFLREKPKNLEVVLTGRNPDETLLELADYVSKIQKIKHPFDKGAPARLGIEM